MAAFVDAVDVNLKGVYYTIEAALPALLRHGDGGAVVITSSAAGFKSVSTTFDTMSHGAAGYTAAKHGVIGVMRHYATSLAEKNIRVNSVHPGGVATPMIINEAMGLLVGDQPEFGEAQRPKLSMPHDGAGSDHRHDGLSVWRLGPVSHRGCVADGRRPDAQVIAL